MRLLYVIDALAGGGAETSLAEMTPHLIADNVELHVLPLNKPLDLSARIEQGGAVVYHPANPASRAQYLRRVHEVTRSVRPDLIHTTLFEADLAGRLVAARSGLPSSTSWVNQRYSAKFSDDVRASRRIAAEMVDRLSCRLPARFHAVSNAVARELGDAMHVPLNRVDVIPRGRAPERFLFRDARARGLIRGAGSRRPDAGGPGCGPSRATKGPACSHRRRRSYAGARLRCGPVDRRTGGSFVGRTPVQGPPGWCEDPVPWASKRCFQLMAGADALAFPSEREGSPGTLIEAMATGLPIVASAIDPNVEVLGGLDQEIAMLVPVHDDAALALALTEILVDPSLATLRAERGRQRFERHYAVEAIGLQMAGFFRKAANA